MKPTTKDEQIITVEQIEQMIRGLETAFSQNDIEGIVAAFAQDATVESPIIARLFNREERVCRGRDEIRELARGHGFGQRRWTACRMRRVTFVGISRSRSRQPHTARIM